MSHFLLKKREIWGYLQIILAFMLSARFGPKRNTTVALFTFLARQAWKCLVVVSQNAKVILKKRPYNCTDFQVILENAYNGPTRSKGLIGFPMNTPEFALYVIWKCLFRVCFCQVFFVKTFLSLKTLKFCFARPYDGKSLYFRTTLNLINTSWLVTKEGWNQTQFLIFSMIIHTPKNILDQVTLQILYLCLLW